MYGSSITGLFSSLQRSFPSGPESMQKRTPPFHIDDEHSRNEYRIHAGRVELRTSSFGQTGDWRQLGADEVIMHLILGTPVARWLLLRAGAMQQPRHGAAITATI